MFDEDVVQDRRTDTSEEPDDTIYCRRCGHGVTRDRWAVSIDGVGEKPFTNPAGHRFVVVCFRDAPGASAQGDPTESFTWFPGYAWNFAVCRECAAHLGWVYHPAADTRDAEMPAGAAGAGAAVFFGLIKAQLSGTPR